MSIVAENLPLPSRHRHGDSGSGSVTMGISGSKIGFGNIIPHFIFPAQT
jgi:hypothetical protein